METVSTLLISESPEIQKRTASLQKHFKQKFGCLPLFYARVPGRVNIIGEHIDYCGYSVLPMAIEQDIIAVVSPNKTNRLNLTNVNEYYPDFSTSTDALKIDQSNPKWYHYFFCGFQGIVEKYGLDSQAPLGMDVAVEGIIPPSAGLSSSSALVCCAALATSHINGINIPKMELATLCAKCERYIGTQGGGMDQAIAFLAEHGSARFIEFNPLKVSKVQLPDGATFVVANSCVEMNKAATSHYNIRVVECHLAAQLIAKAHDLECKCFKRLGDVQDALGVTLEQMPDVVKEVLHIEPYTKEELCKIFDYSPEEFAKYFLTKNTNHLTEFKLYHRAMHVYEESYRVYLFKSICNERVEDELTKLGSLMNESHKSCQKLYECSHEKLDELVKISLQAGALGSRLTGAGWGGCSVSLVPTNRVDEFIKEVKEKFYSKEMCHCIDDKIFATRPGSGAVIYKM